MAEADVIHKMILLPGQSQEDRKDPALDIHYADVDEYTDDNLMQWTAKFAAYVNYYQNNTTTTSGNWTSFFPKTAEDIKACLSGDTSQVQPHLALFVSFIELYKIPQAVINRFTGRHLDFYYKEVLRLNPKAAVPDKVHLVLELKKNMDLLAINASNVFTCKDKSGAVLNYAPTDETIINTSSITSLRSIYRDQSGAGSILYAPIANSSDGLGGKLTGDEPKWYGFGDAGFPQTETGFAISSPVLLMQEGSRKVTVTLNLSNVSTSQLTNTHLGGLFKAYLTGEKAWAGPYDVTATISGNTLTMVITIPSTEKGIVNYSSSLHSYSLNTTSPVIKFNTGSGINYFAGVVLSSAKIEVEVSDIASLTLQNDDGNLDPKKAFMPFGPQPAAGSRFLIGYQEALSKNLSEVKIKIDWKDAPSDFSDLYTGYSDASYIDNSYFTAAVDMQDKGGHSPGSASQTPLFNTSNPQVENEIDLTIGASAPGFVINDSYRMYALEESSLSWSYRMLSSRILMFPYLRANIFNPPETTPGFITFSLNNDFLHKAYRKETVKNMMTFAKQTSSTPPLVNLNEPYTPVIKSIKLYYKAYSDTVQISSTSQDDFSNNDVQFFQQSYAGYARDHGYQRSQFSFLTDKSVNLFYQYNYAGELVLGFSNLNPGDSVSVLFQVAEGSADPDAARENLEWSVLCDNYWKVLSKQEVTVDTTNQMQQSGRIKFTIPTDATLTNTQLPSGYLWLKGGVPTNVHAVCQLIDVQGNAIEAEYIPDSSEAAHLLTSLEKSTITKLKTAVSQIKTISQPYASFDGAEKEDAAKFYIRVSERLRHKDRCITAWDYERIILETFPKVHKVKCIPHSNGTCFLSPGNVLIIVIPDLKNKNAVDPLEPKVDADTISKISDFVNARRGMQVSVLVKNPKYQKVKMDFKVKFMPGKEFNFYSGELNQAIIEFLSPWAFDANTDISFGGIIYKSVLIDFIEDLPYVDYLSDVKMYSYTGNTPNSDDLVEAVPGTPDTILVSDYSHQVNELIRS
jgi:hypothetical protein